MTPVRSSLELLRTHQHDGGVISRTYALLRTLLPESRLSRVDVLHGIDNLLVILDQHAFAHHAVVYSHCGLVGKKV